MTDAITAEDQLRTLRRTAAAFIFGSYAEPAGLTGAQAIAVSAVGDAATALHEQITAAGIDLAPELDELSDQAAAAAFDRHTDELLADAERTADLRTALQSAAVMLRSAADRASAGQQIDHQALRDAARAADEIAGR